MFNQETQTLIAAINGILDGFMVSFVFAGAGIAIGKVLGKTDFTKSRLGRGLNFAWWVSKWPALTYLIFMPFAQLAIGSGMNGLDWVIEALNIYNWLAYRDAGDDDDFWKKKLKKLKEKVAQVGRKLVTIPEPA